MTTLLTEDQQELVAIVRRMLEERLPLSEVRRLSDSDDGIDAGVWQLLAEELGLVGLSVPEDRGGAGASPVEQGLVFEELGRALCCLPYFSAAALAAPALVLSEERRWLPQLLDGSLRATLVGSGRGVLDDEWRTPAAVAERVGTGLRVDGGATHVLDAMDSDLFLVAAQTTEGPSLVAVEASARGVTRRPLSVLDATRRLGEVELVGAPGVLVGPAGGAGRVLARVHSGAMLGLSMEQVGGAQRCLETATAYARTRTQFDRPIGSFQAIKHRCADMFVAVESARVAARHAAAALATDPDHSAARRAVMAAKVIASDAFVLCAKGNIQVHGGMGVTAEHDAHLFYRRAMASNLMLGSPRVLRARLAGQLDDLVGTGG